MWKLDTKGETINDGGRKLKIGTFAYKILGAKSVPDKQDPKGKRQQVQVELALAEDPSYVCRVFISLMSEDDQVRNIAEKTFRALAAAAGIKGILSPERLPAFKGKVVVIAAKETTSGNGKTYVNPVTIEAPEEAPEDSVDDGVDADADSDADADADADSDDNDADDDPPPPPKKPTPKPATKPPGEKPKLPWMKK